MYPVRRDAASVPTTAGPSAAAAPAPAATPRALAGVLGQLPGRLTLLYVALDDGPWGDCRATAHMGLRLVLAEARARGLPALLALVAAAVRLPAEDGPEETGELLLRLAARCHLLTLSFPRPGDGCPFYEVQWTPRWQGRPGLCARLDLAEALREAAGEPEPVKACPHCAAQGLPAVKPLSDFPRDASRRSGRFSWCKMCNREHVRLYSRRMAEIRRGQRPAGLSAPCRQEGRHG